MQVTFVNHATVLIQTRGLNLLTDPIWSERASPFASAGRSATCPPASPSRTCRASTQCC
jgi:L-ascorbate metabolism protein UlaG (beta-lactamase superfamily)